MNSARRKVSKNHPDTPKVSKSMFNLVLSIAKEIKEIKERLMAIEEGIVSF